MKFLSPSKLQGRTVPERQWVVPEWIPMHTTTSLYGDGGTGKSLIAMQLMTALATRRQWLAQPVNPMRSIGFFCEDTEDELHRRQDGINRAYGCEFKDLEDMLWYSGVGEDNTLMHFNDPYKGNLTNLYNAIEQESKDFGAQLIIIDTAADTFGGHENTRLQVRQFISALNKLALEINGATLLCAHPSAAGMLSGRGDGGNTAWNNSVRSRLYFTFPKQEEDEDISDHRILARKKSNYARKDESGLKLIWNKGIFENHVRGPFGMMDGIERNNKNKIAEEAFLKALESIEAQGRMLSSSNRSSNYAPKIMAKSSHCEGMTKKDLLNAMERLFDKGVIKEESYGRPSAPSRKIVRVED